MPSTQTHRIMTPQEQRALRQLCAKADKQQATHGKRANLPARHRRRYLLKHVLKRLPYRAPDKKRLTLAMLLLSSWGLMALPQQALAAPANFTPVIGANNPLNGFDVGLHSTPSFADLDGDGDLDAFIGRYYGTVTYYQNQGTASVPNFIAANGVTVINPLNGFDVGFDAAPSFADLDGDGDLDALIGGQDGTVTYFQNNGTNAVPNFIAANGTTVINPLAGFNVGGHAAPNFVDLDLDGDLDAFVGAANGTVKYYQNTGTSTLPNFIAANATTAINPLTGLDVGLLAKPAFADLDGDGDFDVLIGEDGGTVVFSLNTGTPTAPIFTTATAAMDVGARSAPSFADLDGDGDLDLIVGEFYGQNKYFRNAPPAALSIVSANNVVAGTVGEAYQQPLAATGGIAPYAWAISVGTLPNGLQLNALTGEISGNPVPTTAGVFDITVQVTDAPGTLATLPLTLTINKANQTLTFILPATASVGTTGIRNGFATSGLPVTLTSLTPPICSVSPDSKLITYLTAGLCTLNASQSGDADYNAAPQVSADIRINPRPKIGSGGLGWMSLFVLGLLGFLRRGRHE